MRIAVTGAAGRIGRAVVDLAMTRGHSVVSIDRTQPDAATPGSEVRTTDMADYETLLSNLEGCDALIHLAAIPGPGHLPDHVVHDNNVVASYHALRAAAEAGIGRVCQMSSVNALGGRFSRQPRYDYFPLDEEHPTYAEDPYSLSKWICEQQADAIARRYENMSIASLRLHGVVESRSVAERWADLPGDIAVRHLWGWISREATARACLDGVTADFGGHEAMYVVAPDTMVDTPSIELAAHHYPDVPVRGDLSGTRGFFDCTKAAKVLGWRHETGET